MGEGTIRRSFSLQEAVILLNEYIDGTQKGLPLTRIAEKASIRLRSFAIANGEEVDAGFRSPAGLNNRLHSVAALYTGKESKSAPSTKVFAEAVTMYRKQREQFNELLKASSSGKAPAADKAAEIDKKQDHTVRIKKTKFVRSPSDQALKVKYGNTFRETYYALKRMTDNNKSTVTAIDVFETLERKIPRKEIAEILSAASWAKEKVASNYVFFDAELEERKKKQMEEQIKENEVTFLQWLSGAVSPFVVEEIKGSYGSISAMLVQTKLLPGPLTSINTINQIEAAQRQVKRAFGSKKNRNLATKILSTYISYLREKKNTVLVKEPELPVEVQENWIRFDFTNADLFERTAPVYCSVAGQEIESKTWARILVALAEQEIAKANPNLAELYRTSLVPKRSGRPFFMKKKIDGLNCAELSNGSWINLNHSIPSLMDLIQAFCLYCGYTKNQVLIYGAPKSSISAGKNTRRESKQSGNGIDITNAEEYLLSQGLSGGTVQEIIAAVQPTAVVSPTRKALDDSKNIIAMPQGKYVHVDAFVDLDEAEEELKKIFRTHFAEFGGYSNSALLYGAAALDMSMFLNDNDCDNVDSIYAIARFLFEKKSVTGKPYKFAMPHIFESEPDFPLSLKGLMINLARHNGGVLGAEEAKDYLQKTMLSYGSIGQLLQVYSDSTFLMYDDTQYILSEMLGIDDARISAMHDKLDNLFRQADVAYVIPRDITAAWFETLPALPMGLRWTMLLLQEVIKKYPAIGFEVVKSELDQPYSTIAAAFVPQGSPVRTFPDIVTLYMQEHYQLPKKMTCEELRMELREAGMLEGNEMVYSLYKALDDYRFAWTDENRMVLVRGN